MAAAAVIERISIELGRRCAKGCWFCYNASSPEGDRGWATADMIAFVRDAAANGVRAVSFGGGEPLEHPDVLEILRALDGQIFRSLTTNGLPLDAMFTELVAARPDKVHVSIHFPHNEDEVQRVIRQVTALANAGIASGVNLLVRASQLAPAKTAASALHAAGVANERIVYLPMRHRDTPAPEELAAITGGPFQSMTCLGGCAASPRFCSIGWDFSVAWCSYTESRARLQAPTHAAMLAALDGLGLAFCSSRRSLPVV